MKKIGPKDVPEQETGVSDLRKSTVDKNSKTKEISLDPIETIEQSLTKSNATKQRISVSHGEMQKQTSVMAMDTMVKTPVNFLNVLLLGESGVGKSTFINALANYWVFNSLEEARSNEPIALMPASFLITFGDNFEEKMITFGGVDPNENYNTIGESTTQQCRSYIFTIDDHTKMRLIDTPGMGDARGLDQDDRNMQHILSFISHLSHLNAICILLKPNESKLNIVFRSYLTRLVGFVGEHVRNNIVFCFTNTRRTFFTPGNTGPLLKKMLKLHSTENIPFGKQNTFCFDSESFQYLVARINGIEFDDDQKEDYERSWILSMNESNRLRRYISDALKPYAHKKWRSIDHAQFQIIQLIRPMLETLRNLLRNLILQKESSTRIQLVPKELLVSSTICFTCPFNTECLGQFLVVPDELHIFNDKCNDCNCSRADHIDVEYQLEYTTIDQNGEENVTSNSEQLEQILFKLACFFGHTIRTSEQNDPILRMLTLIIAQEEKICSSNEDKYLNSQLLPKLQQFYGSYKQQRDSSVANNQSMDLPTLYKTIEFISTIDSVKRQRDVSEKCREEYIQQQEKELTCRIRLTDS